MTEASSQGTPEQDGPAMPAADLLRAELREFQVFSGLAPEKSLRRAVEIERLAVELGDVELQMRARLAQANAYEGLGRLAESLRIATDVQEWAARQGDAPVLAYCHMVLSLTYQELGDVAAYLDHAVAGMELLDDDTPAELRLQHVIRLANALRRTTSIEAARERYEQAIELAVAVGNQVELSRAINNLAYAEYEAGNLERAWTVIQPLVSGDGADAPDADSDFLDTAARIQIGLGRYAEAQRTAEASIASYEVSEHEEADALPDYLLTLAAAQRHQGLLDLAQASLDRAAALCTQRDLRGSAALVQQEQAAVHAARGDFEQAYQTYLAYHAAEKALISEQRQAQAAMRQATFETKEAREEAARFREQARTDPLTRLHNRRYVDEQFPTLLHQAHTTDRTVITALLDIDHFKHINDTCSHGIGDQVLTTVAALLAAAVPDTPAHTGSFAARMGGEEFLLILTGMSPHQAITHLDQLRHTIATHDWTPMTGTLPVTISIGVSSIEPDSTQATVLARADEQLYAAKRDGRNRTNVDPSMRTSERRYR